MAFNDQYILPFVAFAFTKSPAEFSENRSPFFEIANAKKLWDFIKEEIERISQINDPFSASRQIVLLSWLIFLLVATF